jgi:hypothetical protein
MHYVCLRLKELQSLVARKEKECLPEFVLTLGSTRLLLVDPRVFLAM